MQIQDVYTYKHVYTSARTAESCAHLCSRRMGSDGSQQTAKSTNTSTSRGTDCVSTTTSTKNGQVQVYVCVRQIWPADGHITREGDDDRQPDGPRLCYEQNGESVHAYVDGRCALI